MAASSLMRLLSWLTTPGNPTMSPHAEGQRGTHHSDIINTVEIREDGGGTQKLSLNGATTNMRIHARVDNRRPLTAQVYQHSKHALAQVHEQTQQNAREHRPLMDASQNSTGHKGTLA